MTYSRGSSQCLSMGRMPESGTTPNSAPKKAAMKTTTKTTYAMATDRSFHHTAGV
eukprot:CAMPEP_0198566216 /NCGR_PEP_ID=MMETSP1462-20131121/102958_1 /TAXON_ID=1333877 /ORGANISM="Brandtodinium nutriculum, Strain RCC3387" /LENGTH=54 /DNA_ID=CAMNT_0044297237 /DNA_START=63 /DNA_END=224 /DNA_ORIENTATION=-